MIIRAGSSTVAAALLLLCPWTASAQSASPVGSFLSPWGGFAAQGPQAITPDGKWVFFVETEVWNWCLGQGGKPNQRISRIRPDGTAHEVLIESPQLKALMIDGTWIKQLRVSGDGKWLTFDWHEAWDYCNYYGVVVEFLVDVEQKSAWKFSHNGMDVGEVSYTDDGSALFFLGWDPVLGWGFFKAQPDGTGAEFLLSIEPWYSAFGLPSGDGSKLLVLGFGNFPYATDAYVFDLASKSLTKVSPYPYEEMDSASISADGSRVVYEGFGDGVTFGLYGVNADGSDHHLVVQAGSGSSATLTRDGKRVFWAGLPLIGDSYTTHRIGWDGTNQVAVGLHIGGTVHHLDQQPVDGVGSMNSWWSGYATNYPLTLTFLDEPRLTTYGSLLPGTTLTWDVCGQPGDAFVLAYATATASLPLGSYGTLGLDPAKTRILLSGVITGPGGFASMPVVLPPDLSLLPQPFTVHSQALVWNGSGPGGAFTNVTTIDLSGGSASATWGGPVGAVRGVAGAAGGLRSVNRERKPIEERIRLLAAENPLVRERLYGPGAARVER